MKVLILSCSELSSYVVDDGLMIEGLEQHGHSVDVQAWDQVKSASIYDCAIVRTTWDYLDKLPIFLDRLQKISEETKLLNDISLIRWNLNKVYLRELAAKQIPIVPTQWILNETDVNRIADFSGEHIVKPTISANAFLTLPIQNRDQLIEHLAAHPNREWMLQPFLREIQTTGEISLHYFNHKFSHAIRKTPKEKDFRVQEEHGGLIVGISSKEEWLAFGNSVLKQIPTPAFQARIDFVETKTGPLLMELELIEPSLYFRTNPNSATQFRLALEASQLRLTKR